jgi:hypothetical protein
VPSRISGIQATSVLGIVVALNFFSRSRWSIGGVFAVTLRVLKPRNQVRAK